MQALEWGCSCEPGFVRALIPMCCGPYHHAWQIGISEAQRQAIYADPKWQDGDYNPNDPPLSGLSVARQVAMVTYRSHSAYESKFGRGLIEDAKAGQGQHSYFQVEAYLRYQGKKFGDRFDAHSYVKITRMMDTHDVGRGRGGAEAALAAAAIPTLIVGVDSDVLYPLHEQQKLQSMIPGAQLHVIRSPHGHDAFLLEQDQILARAKQFLAGVAKGGPPSKL